VWSTDVRILWSGDCARFQVSDCTLCFSLLQHAERMMAGHRRQLDAYLPYHVLKTIKVQHVVHMYSWQLHVSIDPFMQVISRDVAERMEYGKIQTIQPVKILHSWTSGMKYVVMYNWYHFDPQSHARLHIGWRTVWDWSQWWKCCSSFGLSGATGQKCWCCQPHLKWFGTGSRHS
jgi:hypothetical protein